MKWIIFTDALEILLRNDKSYNQHLDCWWSSWNLFCILLVVLGYFKRRHALDDRLHNRFFHCVHCPLSVGAGHLSFCLNHAINLEVFSCQARTQTSSSWLWFWSFRGVPELYRARCRFLFMTLRSVSSSLMFRSCVAVFVWTIRWKWTRQLDMNTMM